MFDVLQIAAMDSGIHIWQMWNLSAEHHDVGFNKTVYKAKPNQN